ncbi:MAG: hypothetical protein M3503_02455 [Actinomycetota bacterium]|nr:hypothetical protein [Actinomycetota bacterium]
MTRIGRGSGVASEVDGDAEVVGDGTKAAADVALGTEPELVAMDEAGGEGLDDEQAAGAVAGADAGGLVEQQAGSRIWRTSG